MNTDATTVGVLGASGYSGRELIALLAHHARARLRFATSESESGTSVRRISAAAPEMPLVRAEDAPLGECDVVFSCLPHGTSLHWVERAHAAGARVIDLSSDLRVPSAETPEWAAGAVYGLPELHRDRIAGAGLVANPGCYPTAALLALAPLLRRGLVAGPVIVSAASGVTGAGRSPKRELLFAEVAENFRAYGLGNSHRHLSEMRHQAAGLSGGEAPELVFVPHLLPVQRGILETIHVPLREPLGATALELWQADYADEPFVEVLADGVPSLREVVGTNRVAVGVVPVAGVSAPLLQVVAAIDNLQKGASGQAVQNLNLMCGWPETEGLL
jgi:N-acetyl-gamma-glutamyl-phosphate reductase